MTAFAVAILCYPPKKGGDNVDVLGLQSISRRVTDVCDKISDSDLADEKFVKKALPGLKGTARQIAKNDLEKAQKRMAPHRTVLKGLKTKLQAELKTPFGRSHVREINSLIGKIDEHF